MSAEDEERQQRLAQFHERNQQFLSQSSQNNNNIIPAGNNNSDTLHLNKEILELQLQVRQLTHELETTRDAYHLSSDKSRAEIAMLQSQIEHENSRHEKIITSLQNRLVESELARVKLQEQLEESLASKTKDEEENNNRWMEMTSMVAEENKWVDEQMDHWKESMEERRSRLHYAKMRGTIIDAGVMDDTENRAEKEAVDKGRAGRRSRQRQLWGKDDYILNDDDDDDDDDSECDRIFGK